MWGFGLNSCSFCPPLVVNNAGEGGTRSLLPHGTVVMNQGGKAAILCPEEENEVGR